MSIKVFSNDPLSIVVELPISTKSFTITFPRCGNLTCFESLLLVNPKPSEPNTEPAPILQFLPIFVPDFITAFSSIIELAPMETPSSMIADL